MKAIYMVDVPKIGDCDSCPLYDIDDVMNGAKMVCLADKEEGEVCPLRPLPSPLEENHNLWTNDRDEETFKEGFNRCLEVITGEPE